MGVLDKWLNYMKLNDSEDDDEYDEDGYLDDGDEEEESRPSRRPAFSSKPAREEDDEEEEPAPPKRTPAASRPSSVISKVTPMRSNMKKTSVGGGMEVCVIKPNSFEEAREITETLLKDRTIVMNLEGLDVEIAQRILDFTSGSCFAIGGNLQKISMYIFIITPASVDISGDFQEILGSFDASLHTVL